MQILFGALSPPLHKQLGVAKSQTEWHQKMADAITLLSIQQIMTHAEADKARNRLLKRIGADLFASQRPS